MASGSDDSGDELAEYVKAVASSQEGTLRPIEELVQSASAAINASEGISQSASAIEDPFAFPSGDNGHRSRVRVMTQDLRRGDTPELL
ncbi:MAG: hypothetical protein M1819_001213 [Sarea resinae]|nr:MAG: hypothetical protein M1819_001213 [Sarea resinae]